LLHNAHELFADIAGRTAVEQWALPVGGNSAALERCRPLLSCFAKNAIHIGDCGSGHKVKLLNQMMFGAINAMTAEMMAIASRVGVAPALLYETITASPAGTVSNLFKELGRRVAGEDYADPTFTVDLLIKDIKLGIEMACAPPGAADLGQNRRLDQ
jgi:3-hydroxyisobutyrate dehydrogenase